MLWIYISIFIASCLLLYFSGELVVRSLMRVAKFLSWREFVVTFFLISFAASIPELFIGIFSAINKIPQLALGNVVGANVVNLTLVIALASLLTNRGISTKSRLIQESAIFTIFIAILPIFLIFDGILSRGDGLVLIFVFLLYNLWLFSKKERFAKIYDGDKIHNVKIFLKDLGKTILGIIILLMAAEGIVQSATYFSKELNFPIALVGILIVGLGTSIPDLYFSIVSARSGQSWMVLGNAMGSVIIVSTLVLGIVALICPIEILHFSPFAIARFFLIISAMFFLLFVRTGHKITKNEALFLLSIYLLFVIVEILLK